MNNEVKQILKTAIQSAVGIVVQPGEDPVKVRRDYEEKLKKAQK